MFDKNFPEVTMPVPIEAVTWNFREVLYCRLAVTDVK